MICWPAMARAGGWEAHWILRPGSALPEAGRQGLEAEFQEIFEMSCEKGTWAILDEARHRWRDDPGRLGAFIETLSSQPSHSHRAWVTRLNHSECWRGAARVRQAEPLPHWSKRKHLGHRPAAMDPSSLDHLADLIGAYFQRSEARGGHCLVEPLRRGKLDCFHAYPPGLLPAADRMGRRKSWS